MFSFFFFIPGRPTNATRTNTIFPTTTLFRSWMEEDRDDRACNYQVSAFMRQHAELRSYHSNNERKFTDLREARRDRQRSLARITKCPDDKEGRDRLAENDDRDRCQKRKRLLDDHRRIEQHAD